MASEFPLPDIVIQSEEFDSINFPMARDVVAEITEFIINIDPLRESNAIKVLVRRSPYPHPQCRRMNGCHEVLIDDSGGEEFQWIFQFAHEYLHHFICGDLSGEKDGLWWFEEIMCSLSSLYHLWRRSTLRPGSLLFSRTFPPLPASDYLETFLKGVSALSSGFHSNPAPCQWVARMKSDTGDYDSGQYDLFHAVAACMLPYFQRNRNLWRLVRQLHMSRNYTSLSAILPTMLREADNTYRGDLLEMMSYLLPRLENNVNFTIA